MPPISAEADPLAVAIAPMPQAVDLPAPAAGPRTTFAGRLYAVVWRWHFYAGLITAPVLMLVTLTGALYTFRTELTAWRDRALLVVGPRSERLSYDALLETAASAPGMKRPEALVVSADPGRSVQFISGGGKRGRGGGHGHSDRRMYVDPYTGKVLGSRVDSADVFGTVLELHRSLMLGKTGRVLNELATSWGLVLLATGVYLWWPRGKSNVGVWLARLRGKPYAVLRDWHAVGGLYLVPLIALVTATGLFFTVVWGTGFNNTVKQAGHWPARWFETPKVSPPRPDAPPAPLDAVVASIMAHARPDDSAMVRLAPDRETAHKAFLMRDEDKNSLRLVTVDPYSARTLDVIDVADLPMLYRVRVWAVSIHTGQIFGTPTKVLALVASLALFGLSFTGVWMWWVRRPRGGAGLPRRPPPRSLPAWGWLVLLATGLAMPVAGASMIAVGLTDLAVTSVRRRG